jgi:hypothetical protein
MEVVNNDFEGRVRQALFVLHPVFSGWFKWAAGGHWSLRPGFVF